MRDCTIQTQPGARLQFREDGDLSGKAVFGIHGTPGCRVTPESFAVDARRKGIRLITYDRPGYGGSSIIRGRRVVDAAENVAAIADHLGIDRFGVWGISGGGAPALACAAMLPDRVAGAASLAGVAPYAAEGLDWYAGMGEANVEDFKLMLSDQPAWERKSRKDTEELRAATADQLRAMWASLLSDADRAGLNAEVANFLLSSIKEGLQHGDEGMREDSLSQCRPWGFDPGRIRAPVQIWQGAQDLFVPFSHGQWLASHVSGAEAHLLPDEGHLTLIVRQVPSVHTWLVSRL